MVAHKAKAYLSIIVLGLSLQFSIPTQKTCADCFDDGVRFYSSGKYAEAVASFKKEIGAFPESVDAHYYLANTLAKLHRNQEAMTEYEKAIKLSPDSTAGKYSATALSRLSAPSTAEHEPANERKTSSSTTEKASEPESKRANQTLKVGDEAAAQESSYQKEADALIARINSEADARIKALEADREAALAPYKSTKYTNTAPVTADSIRADYDAYIDAIRQEAKRKSDAAQRAANEKGVAMEDTAIGLDKDALQQKNASTRLVPDRSNMHVRSYVTEQEPTGDPVGVLAAQKSLEQSRAKAGKSSKNSAGRTADKLSK